MEIINNTNQELLNREIYIPYKGYIVEFQFTEDLDGVCITGISKGKDAITGVNEYEDLQYAFEDEMEELTYIINEDMTIKII